MESVLGSEADRDVDESKAVSLVLAAGDVEVHHPNIMHGSDANVSEYRRCGLTIRYIPTSTKIVSDEQPWTSVFHFRGKAWYKPVPALATVRPGPSLSLHGGRGPEQDNIAASKPPARC